MLDALLLQLPVPLAEASLNGVVALVHKWVAPVIVPATGNALTVTT